MDIRILVVVVMGDLADHVGIVVGGVVLDEVHLELTLGQGIRIEMGDEMRHIIVELDHRLWSRPRRRSSGCFVCCSVVGVVLAIFVDIILSRSDREDSHILGYTGSRERFEKTSSEADLDATTGDDRNDGLGNEVR